MGEKREKNKRREGSPEEETVGGQKELSGAPSVKWRGRWETSGGGDKQQ